MIFKVTHVCNVYDNPKQAMKIHNNPKKRKIRFLREKFESGSEHPDETRNIKIPDNLLSCVRINYKLRLSYLRKTPITSSDIHAELRAQKRFK